jgi:hypothetical protein
VARIISLFMMLLVVVANNFASMHTHVESREGEAVSWSTNSSNSKFVKLAGPKWTSVEFDGRTNSSDHDSHCHLCHMSFVSILNAPLVVPSLDTAIESRELLTFVEHPYIDGFVRPPRA